METLNKVRKRWTQKEADEALVRMEPALEDDYIGEDKYALRETFVNADLSGLNFEGANLTNADLYKADLTDVFLFNANLFNADLFNTILFRATISKGGLDDVRYRAHIKGYDTIRWV